MSQLRSKRDKDRHRYHLHVRNVTKQLRSLGRILQRSGSSTYSIRSEFPAPPRSTERRLLARDSADIWPSSGSETPLFNTPESDVTGFESFHSPGHHFDPLAMASMMIATAELDRLSGSRTSESSGALSGSSPNSHTPLYSGNASPHNGTSVSGSTTLDMYLTPPLNTPASSGLDTGMASPVSRPSHRRGGRRRGQRSHLSEVTTPDEIASPAEPAEEFSGGPPSFAAPQIETLPECKVVPNSRNEDSLYPKPLAISKSSRDEIDTPDDGPSGDTQGGQLQSASAPPSSLRPVSPQKHKGPLRRSRGSSLDTEGSISAPARVSSVGKGSESTYGAKPSFDMDRQPLLNLPLGLGHNIVISPPISRTGTDSVKTSGSVSNSEDDSHADSCHPDTWSESQGEPGDSDPFCPSDCLETRHNSQNSSGRPSGPARQGTDETVRKLGASGGAKRE